MNSSSPKPTPLRPAIDNGSNDDKFSDRPRNLRRRKKRRLSSTFLFRLRLFGMALGGIVFAFAAFRFMQKVVHPYRLGSEVSQQVAVARTQYKRQEQENAVLEEKLMFLRSKEGAEVLARRAGFHLKGEVVYLFPAAQETTDGSSAPSVTQ